MLDISKFVFSRLDPNTEIFPFDCGDEDLNSFLFDDAKNHSESLLSVTYLLTHNDRTVAFFSYLNDKISHKDLDNNIALFKKRIGSFLNSSKSGFKSYPAVKLGRLGVDKEYQSQGLGKDILNFTKASFTTNNKTGCKFITVDAYSQSLKFYSQNDFKFLSSKDENSDTRLMYYNLDVIISPG